MLILLQTQSQHINMCQVSRKPNHNMSKCVDFAANPITTCQHVLILLQTQSQHVKMCRFCCKPNHNMSKCVDFAANPITTCQHVYISAAAAAVHTQSHHVNMCRFLLLLSSRACCKPNHDMSTCVDFAQSQNFNV